MVGGSQTGLELLLAPFLASKITGRVSYRVEVPLTPEQAYARIVRGLFTLWRTRTSAVYPEPIRARCFFDDFRDTPLAVRFELDPTEGGTTIEIAVDMDRNRSQVIHGRRRDELRRFAEFLASR